jgi:hypothetical protein
MDEVVRRVNKVQNDGHACKLARAIANGEAICKEWQGKEGMLVHGDRWRTLVNSATREEKLIFRCYATRCTSRPFPHSLYYIRQMDRGRKHYNHLVPRGLRLMRTSVDVVDGGWEAHDARTRTHPMQWCLMCCTGRCTRPLPPSCIPNSLPQASQIHGSGSTVAMAQVKSREQRSWSYYL